MYAIDSIHCKRDPIKTLLAHDTGKAARVVGLACRPQDAVQNRVATYTALL